MFDPVIVTLSVEEIVHLEIPNIMLTVLGVYNYSILTTAF
jgi:hypothetical protein